jgi:NADH-quinone oxidoreductase subunit E
MMGAVFDGPVLEDARAIIGRYPDGRERSAIMPLLYLAQSEQGMVTREAMGDVAALLDITPAEVEAVASFYTMYRLRPTGEHLVNVCTNLACMLRGAKDVFEAAHAAAGTTPGQDVSDDGLVTVHEEECLGVCDFAPAVQIDLANHDEVTPEGVADLIAQLRAGQVPSPSRGPALTSFRHASRVLAGLDEVQVT